MPCSSCNPCLFCNRGRSKVGGISRWAEEEGELRTIGSLHMMYAGWVNEGSRQGAEHTKIWDSVTEAVLVEGVGDSWDMELLDKVSPPSLHLFLGNNELFNHMESTCYPDIKADLKEFFGIVAHSYQGRERNYQGPELRQVFRGLHKLIPRMQDHPIRKLYLEVLISMRKVNEGIFGMVLDPGWRETLEQLRSALAALIASTTLNLTPKFHMITVRVVSRVLGFMQVVLSTT